VGQLASNGFALQGGRVDIVQGRTAAGLVYRSRDQVFDVFIWRTSESDDAAHAGTRQGYQWIDWRKDRLEFCAVSDAAPSDLQTLQRLLALSSTIYGRVGAKDIEWAKHGVALRRRYPNARRNPKVFGNSSYYS